jgi:hypothetical protein
MLPYPDICPDVLCGHEDLVATNLGVNNLRDDVLVGETDDHAVLGRIVLVLGLGDQPLTSIVIGCAHLATVFPAEENGTHSCPRDGACTSLGTARSRRCSFGVSTYLGVSD